MVTQTEIDKAYEELKEAYDWMHAAGEIEIQTKNDIEKKRLRYLADGIIDGKNQAMREASAAEVLKKELETLETVERDARAARLNLDIAKAEVSRVQALLRLAEL